MKSSNKKRIVTLNLLMIVLSIAILLLIIMYRISQHLIPFQFLREYGILILFFFLLLMIVTSLLRWQMIFEYDTSGEVMSIKNYRWYLMNKKNITSVFEMPKRQIAAFEVKYILFWKYLVISFQSDSGKAMKVRINITGCTQKQIYRMHLDFSRFLIS